MISKYAYDHPLVDVGLWYFVEINGYYHLIGEQINIYSFKDRAVRAVDSNDRKPFITRKINELSEENGIAITDCGTVYRLCELSRQNKNAECIKGNYSVNLFEDTKNDVFNDYCLDHGIDISSIRLVGIPEIAVALIRL